MLRHSMRRSNLLLMSSEVRSGAAEPREQLSSITVEQVRKMGKCEYLNPKQIQSSNEQIF